jgi:hypothetical protein
MILIDFLENLGPLPDASEVIALGHDANGDHLIAFETTTALAGGVVARPGDIVRYDGAAYSIDWAAADLDAVMVPEPAISTLLAAGALWPGVFMRRC